MSFARHSSTDELVNSLDKMIDKFVETAMGLLKTRPVFPEGTTLKIVSFVSDSQATALINELASYLENLRLDNRSLTNIRDDFLSEVYKHKFLFTLS